MMSEYNVYMRCDVIPVIRKTIRFFSFNFCHRIRGTLISLYDPFLNTGMFFAFLLGKYFDYAIEAMYLMLSTIVFVILFADIPETYQHLVKMEKQKVVNG